ncbi:MAG: ChbG/HpnK family deacetylase [Phycisphaerales bacterium]|nr:ChbG/HpnK family deacetylase [Phycisphaerales bacterium]
MQVVVNVDDLGLHPAVRRAVEALAARGSVTSASVLANGPDVRAATRVRGVSLGAHLNILRGRPLSPGREVRTLLGADGLFLGDYGALWRRVVARGVKLDEVRLEWSRQIERLLERGIALSHLDGEKHTHCWPALMPVACELAQGHGIPWVRRSSDPFVPLGSPTAMLRTWLLRRWCRRAVAPAGVRFPDATWGIFDQGDRLDPRRMARALRQAPNLEVVEVVCHPGEPHSADAEIDPSFGRLRVRSLWEPERRRLDDDAWRQVAAEEGWTLTGFDGIAASNRGRERGATTR